MLRTSDESAIREAFPMPDSVRAHARAANWDLHYGPLGRNHWREDTGNPDAPDYDWCESREVLADWIDDIGTVYYEPDSGCIMDREPEGEWIDADGNPCDSDAEGAEWCEPCPYYELTGADIADAFGYRTLYRS